jgi:hypothetical protein
LVSYRIGRTNSVVDIPSAQPLSKRNQPSHIGAIGKKLTAYLNMRSGSNAVCGFK